MIGVASLDNAFYSSVGVETPTGVKNTFYELVNLKKEGIVLKSCGRTKLLFAIVLILVVFYFLING